jgi:hypothetical protein
MTSSDEQIVNDVSTSKSDSNETSQQTTRDEIKTNECSDATAASLSLQLHDHDHDDETSSTKSEPIKLADFYVNLVDANTANNLTNQLNTDLMSSDYQHVEQNDEQHLDQTNNDENYDSLRMSDSPEYQLTSGGDGEGGGCMQSSEFISSSNIYSVVDSSSSSVAAAAAHAMHSNFVIDYNVPVFGSQTETEAPLQKTLIFDSTFKANCATASNTVDPNEPYQEADENREENISNNDLEENGSKTDCTGNRDETNSQVINDMNNNVNDDENNQFEQQEQGTLNEESEGYHIMHNVSRKLYIIFK